MEKLQKVTKDDLEVNKAKEEQEKNPIMNDNNEKQQQQVIEKPKKQENVKADDDQKQKLIIMDDAKFEKDVLNSQYAWFIKFYAPWCGHCKAMAKTWNDLAEELNDSKNVRIAHYDATAHKKYSKELGVSSYPTILYFPKGSKDISKKEKYSGARTIGDFTKFLADKLKIKIEEL